MSKFKLEPIVAASFSGINADILIGGGGLSFCLTNLVVEEGLGAPSHISFEEDKVFHVARGRFRFLVGTEQFDVVAGEQVFVGKGEVHGFKAVGGRAVMSLFSTPSGHDQFFLALSDLPTPHQPEMVAKVCDIHKHKLLVLSYPCN